MDVAEIEVGARDDNHNPPSDAPIDSICAASTHNGHPVSRDGLVEVKAEDEVPTAMDDDGGVTERPIKRRKLESLTPRRSTSRAISPPWKSFSADGPTTIIDNGIRKSGRFNRETAAPEPKATKRSTRHAAKPAQPNGSIKNGIRRAGTRAASGPVPVSKSKATPVVTKKASTQSLKSPAPRKSERQRRPSAVANTASLTSPVQQNGSPESAKKRPGRPRKSTLISDANDSGHFKTPATPKGYAYTYAPPSDIFVTSPDASDQAPRLRLRLRKPDPPNRHPQHATPARKFSSFTEWLQKDDPLEGEEGQRTTKEKADEEAARRLQIVEAAENGVLSKAQCSIYTPQPAEEPPPQYNRWDHVVAHALHFNKLLRDESAFHKKIAKTLAREAADYWKSKYKYKTQEEIQAEEKERAIMRYKQLVKDVKDLWTFVKAEIDKERVAKWEEEQLQLGHKAMDDMFNQAQEILGRGVVDSASSYVSDEGYSEDEEGELRRGESDASGTEDEEQDENMSSSGSDNEEGDTNDEDANLTAEQLQAKYGQLPDLPVASSDDESDMQEENEEGSEDDGTPEPTPDPHLDSDEDVDMLTDPYPRTNGFHEHDSPSSEKNHSGIDPAAIELEEVDEALLDSDTEHEKTSRSGSEEWSSESEEDDDEVEAASEVDNDIESESGSDDVGVMGFLSNNEIKKMKEAAKATLEKEDEITHVTGVNGVNGHHEAEESATEDVIEVEPHLTNGTHDVRHDSKPTAEISPVEGVDDHNTDKTMSRSRSRHSSEPPRTEVPSLLRGTLREYQHGGLDWLANLYATETNGILADEMGLGKTIQTIALLSHIAVHRGIWGPHLVVVPTSVMLNWEMEFKKWCPGFKILTYYGDIAERKRKRLGWRNPGPDMINVVITSYQLILQDAAAFKMRAWQYLILDEAHNIKNFKSQRWQVMLNLRTERRLLLTGTPLQNNIDELWSLLYFLMPAGFAGEGRIAGLEEFTMALKNPTSQILEQGRQQLDAEAQKIVKKLHEVLRPYLLRRLKADVEKQMPAKYEHVVYCKLSKRQRQLYDGFMGRASTKAILSSGNYMSIINCLMSLRKVCNHPDLFETRAIVTSMAMPKSVASQYEIKDLLIRKRLHDDMEDKRVNLDALNLILARREQTSMLHARRARYLRATRPLEDLVERQTRRLNHDTQPKSPSLQYVLSAMADRETLAVRDHLKTCLRLTRSRTQFLPAYGKGLIERLTMDYQDYVFGAQTEGPAKKLPPYPPLMHTPSGMQQQVRLPVSEEQLEHKDGKKGELGFRAPRCPLVASEWHQRQISSFQAMVPTLEERAASLEPIITKFTCVTPAVAAEELAPLTLSKKGVAQVRSSEMVRNRDPFHESRMRQSIAFPDKRLLQYDCGKLQRLATLLRDLQAGGHRALIFTQMTKVLDILEQFLNIHGHRYLRLDGATKVEQRQLLTDRFNNDPRILCFILSSRSGGLGINLTGADTVIFYDLDWNPAMDKQCQDRSHRIGQTRDVHIYKFVSEYTIEANILRKSNQKRLLDDVIIQKGDFTTDYFNKVTWRDALDHEPVDEAGAAMDRVLGEKAGLLGDAQVMREVEDTEDRTAATVAQKEIVDEIHDDEVDFNESSATTPANALTRATSEAVEQGKSRDVNMKHIDEYMLTWCRAEYGNEPYRPPTDRQKRHRKGQDVHRTHRKKLY